jgi:hypothetical protein
MTLPFKVYSQTRSGTHLTMATLYKNFDFGCDLSIRVKVPNHKFDGKEDAVVPWGKLHGSHSLRTNEDISKALYVVRHPITRAYSLWKFGRREQTFEDFATVELFARWKEHVDSWNDAYVVRYEELDREYLRAATLWRVHSHFGLTSFFGNNYKRVDERVGWSPTLDALAYCPPKVIETAVSVLGDYYFDYQIEAYK